MSKQKIPANITLKLPQKTLIEKNDQHFLLYIPWDKKYLELIPQEYRSFFEEILPYLSARTADVHIAQCMNFLDEYIDWAESQNKKVNKKVLAYALMLHDVGWSQLSQAEIAASLGVTGLAINKKAKGPKEKHAIAGEKIARKILKQKKNKLKLTDAEIDLICQAILYHDKPEEVAGLGKKIPIEIQLLVDLDHIWSFTHLNFWQDTVRKGISPTEYLKNLQRDLDSYFVTEFGKQKAKKLLKKRHAEVLALSAE